MTVVPDSEDAFGRALLDRLEERPGPPLILEGDDGSSSPALQPSWFLAPYEEWPWWERRAIALASGRVLDLGCGAGRWALHLQRLGHESRPSTGRRVQSTSVGSGGFGTCGWPT